MSYIPALVVGKGSKSRKPLPKLSLLAPESKEAKDAEDALEEAGSISALAAAALRARGLQPDKDAKLDKRMDAVLGSLAPKSHKKSFFGRGTKTKAKEEDLVVQRAGKKQKLKPYDMALKQFEYAKALNAALATRRSAVVVSVLQEFFLRGEESLRRALLNRTDKELAPLLEFLVQGIGNPHYVNIVMDTAHVVLDLYGRKAGESLLLDEQLAALNRKIKSECQLQQRLALLSGSLEMVLAFGHHQQAMHPRLAPIRDDEVQVHRYDVSTGDEKEETMLLGHGTRAAPKSSNRREKTAGLRSSSRSAETEDDGPSQGSASASERTKKRSARSSSRRREKTAGSRSSSRSAGTEEGGQSEGSASAPERTKKRRAASSSRRSKGDTGSRTVEGASPAARTRKKEKKGPTKSMERRSSRRKRRKSSTS